MSDLHRYLQRYHLGPFLLDTGLHRLFKGDRSIHLKPKEWELLCYLVENHERVLSKEELLERLWPRQEIREANLSQAVYGLRKCLDDSAKGARWIETVPRLGFRFVGPVAPLEDGPGAAQGRVPAMVPNLGGTTQLDGSPSLAKGREAVPTEAQAAYLRGRYCWNLFTEPALSQALVFFDEALAAAPRFAAAHAWRSAAWSALGNIGALAPRNSAEHARRAAERAITIDDCLAAGYEMRGVVELYFDWNFEAAMGSFKRAIERDPESANAYHLLANTEAFTGNFEPALNAMECALSRDPTALITRTDAAFICYLAGHYAEALERLDSVLSQNPRFPHARLKRAFVLAALGGHDAALAECAQVAQDLGTEVFGARACLLGLAGRRRQARRVMDRLEAQAGHDVTDPCTVALGWLGLGDSEQALVWLERAMDYRSRDLVLLRTDPVWQPLRGHEVFERLLREIGFAPNVES